MVRAHGFDGTDVPGVGIGKRQGDQKITAYIAVPSVDGHITKVESLGRKFITSKMSVRGWFYLIICLDKENNTFGLWEDNADAK